VLAMLLLLSLLVRTLGVGFLADPWNPNITVLPFGLFLFLCWDMTCGGAWSLPLAAGVGSFLVQSHLGYAPVTAVLGLFGMAWLIKDVARTRASKSTLRQHRRTFARAAVAAAAVVIVVWTPPVMEQLIHRQGNLDKLTDYVSHPRDRHSLADSYKIVAFQLGVRPEWLTRPHPRNPFTGELLYSRPPPLPVLLVAFIAASAFAFRRRYSTVARLAATVGLGLLVAVVSVSQIRGPVFSYLVRWTWVLGMATALVVVWAGLLLLSNRRAPSRPSPAPILMLGIIAVTTINLVAATRAAPPAARESRLLNTLAHSTLRELPRGHKAVLLHWTSSSFPTYAYGLAAELERHGIEVSVEPFAEMLFGAERVAAKPKAETVLFVATQDDIDRYDARPSYRRIARVSDLSQTEAAKVRAQIAELSTRHDAGLLTNAQYRLELAKLLNIGTEVVVFASDAQE
jgi:hypothetical protein